MIYTPDTDVIIAGMSVCSEIEAEIYVMTGKGNARRIIDITKVSGKENRSLKKSTPDEVLELMLIARVTCEGYLRYNL